MTPRDRAKSLIGPLHDSLRADVYPRASRHLAVHHQAFLFELAEVFPRRPASHEVAVRDQHARRTGMRTKNADWFSALHEQRFIVAQRLELAHDRVEGVPIPRGLSGSSVDDEILRSF